MQSKIIFLTCVIFTQVITAQNLSVGFKDGISWASVRYTEYGSYDNFRFDNQNGGRNSGVLINYQIGKNMFIQSEFDLSNKGFKIKSLLSTGGGFNASYNMNYFSIPVTAGYEIGEKIKYYGFGGLNFSILYSAKSRITTTSTAEPNLSPIDNSYDPTNDFNKKEMGLIIGVGVKIPLCKNVKFFIDNRYEYGLTRAVKKDLEEQAYRYPSFIKDVYNKAFSINWGILYSIPKKE